MKHILTIIPLLLILAACGFEPMYGSHSFSADKTEARQALSQIKIVVIPDHEGQFLRNDLIDQINQNGEPDRPLYSLRFTELNVTVHELDLTKNSEATRSQIIAATTMLLIDNKTGETILSRPVKSISSYNILPSKFATRVTEENARETALKDISRQIVQQLTLYFNR